MMALKIDDMNVPPFDRSPEMRMVDPPLRIEEDRDTPPEKLRQPWDKPWHFSVWRDLNMREDHEDLKSKDKPYVKEGQIRDTFKWDRFFLGMAQYVSTASKDPSTKVGAIIVDENRIVVGQGYNGFPRGVVDSPERYADREWKYPLVVHAELNAILNSGGRTKGATIYVYPSIMMPAACPECAKAIVQSGIKRIIYYHNDHVNESKWKDSEKFTRIILGEGGVTCLSIPEPPRADLAMFGRDFSGAHA